MAHSYDEDKLKKAQRVSLDILLAVDKISRMHGLRYMLDSGTLLGAVRHGGFIPWDDDVDIVMTRAEYESFKDYAMGELPKTMQLITPDSFRRGTAFYDFTPRIIYLPSKRHSDSEEMEYYEGKLNHLWVDIFILDNISDNAVMDMLTRTFHKFIYGLSMAWRYGLDMSKYKGIDKLAVGTLSMFGKMCGMKTLFKLQEKTAVRVNGKNTKRLYYSNYQPDFLHVTIDSEWISKPYEIKFEGHMLMAPKSYDEVLKEIYGNYMELPPESERHPSHSDEIEVFG